MNNLPPWEKPFATDPEVVALEIACKLNFSTCEIAGTGGLCAREIVEQRLRIFKEALKDEFELERRRTSGGSASPTPGIYIATLPEPQGLSRFDPTSKPPAGAGDPPSGAGGGATPKPRSAAHARAKSVDKRTFPGEKK